MSFKLVSRLLLICKYNKILQLILFYFVLKDAIMNLYINSIFIVETFKWLEKKKNFFFFHCLVNFKDTDMYNDFVTTKRYFSL